MRGFCLLLPIILLCTCLPAQEIHFAFNHLTTDQGLAANEVNAIAQDSRGYIWIGTSHGLQRYDGIRFRNFRYNADDSSSIPSNVVEQLFFDREDRLWLRSREGVTGIFDTRKMIFRQVDVYDGDRRLERLPDAELITDAWGNLFLLDTSQGLFVWEESQRRFYKFRFAAPPLNDRKVSGLAPWPGTADYVLSFADGGIYLFHSQEGRWINGQEKLAPLELDNFPQAWRAYHLHIDQQNRLWLQFWPFATPKIYCYDLTNGQELITDYEPYRLVGMYIETSSFFESKNGNLWLYGSDIFARFQEGQHTFQLVRKGYVNRRSIQYRMISTLFEDRENTIWVGTHDNGIFFFNPGKEYFRNVDHISRRTGRRGNGSPMAFLELADSTILVSTWGEGIYLMDRNWKELPLTFRGEPELVDHSIWSIYPSRRKGIIWMSMQPGGIIQFDEYSRQARRYRSDILANRTVRQVVEDHSGDLWLGMQSTGLFHWKVNEDGQLFPDAVSRFEGLSPSTINKLVIDSQGLLWVATESQGLYQIDPVSEQVLLHLAVATENPDLRLRDPSVSSILEYNDSLLVISGASSLQLYDRRRKKLSRIRTDEVMAGYISDLQKDGSGHVWVSTTSGLYRVNIFDSNILRFGRRDGIDDDYYIPASSGRLADGRLLFGSSETFVVFDPEVFNQVENDRPEATITALQVNNRLVPEDSVLMAGELRLHNYENALSIEFSTLQFYRSNSVRYKMQDLDQDWQVNENNLAVYSYLPAGSYHLLLQPIYLDGTLGSITSLAITRNPPLWRAWWFYSLLSLLIGWIIYLFDRERVRRRKSVQFMRAKIADDLHAEIKTALNSIHILSEMATIKSRNDPSRATEYLGQINSRSQQMMQAMDDILWTVAPENDSMEKVVHRIEEYVHRLRSAEQVVIDLLVDPEVSQLVLHMRKRQLLLRLIKESIQVLLKAGAGNQRVHLGREKTELGFAIEFDRNDMDATLLNNLLHSGEMLSLLSDMGANQQLTLHHSRGYLSFEIPL